LLFLRLLKRPRDQIERSVLEILPEVLVPSQFPALAPGQPADDVFRNPTEVIGTPAAGGICG